MSFRFVSTIERAPNDPVPPGYTGRVRRIEGGRVIEVAWYADGEFDDPGPRTPAAVRFRASGEPKQIRHYRQGRLHDPALGTAAVVGYFEGGAVRYREHFRYGRRHDYGDTPAITKWRKDGTVRTTHHYYEGLRIEPVLRTC